MPRRQAVSQDVREHTKHTEFGKGLKGIERVGKETCGCIRGSVAGHATSRG